MGGEVCEQIEGGNLGKMEGKWCGQNGARKDDHWKYRQLMVVGGVYGWLGKREGSREGRMEGHTDG